MITKQIHPQARKLTPAEVRVVVAAAIPKPIVILDKKA